MIKALRTFFEEKGYLEVETPSRIPVPVPEEHIEPFQSEGWYLQSSPEICMKRLIARGYEKIFQICKCFRKNERGNRHLTEMTMLEWYRKGYSYMELMTECKALIRHVAEEMTVAMEEKPTFEGIADTSEKKYASPGNIPRLFGKQYHTLTDHTLTVEYGSHRISLDEPWQQIPVSEAFRRYSTITMEAAEKEGRFDEIMAFDIEPNLGITTPAFIYDYPASKAALAKLKSGNCNLAERFELYIAGVELANGFSELTDPVEQKARFIKTIEKCRPSGNPVMSLPEKFIADLEKMPATAGIALGIDRLAMIFANTPTIDEVVTFTPEEL